MALEITAILAGTVAAATPLIFAGLGNWSHSGLV